jgi:hypothetical protein
MQRVPIWVVSSVNPFWRGASVPTQVWVPGERKRLYCYNMPFPLGLQTELLPYGDRQTRIAFSKSGESV